MKSNMGSTDRIIRILLAVVIGILYFTGTVSSSLGLILVVVGVLLLFTSLIGFCPVYAPFKFSTRK